MKQSMQHLSAFLRGTKREQLLAMRIRISSDWPIVVFCVSLAVFASFTFLISFLEVLSLSFSNVPAKLGQAWNECGVSLLEGQCSAIVATHLQFTGSTLLIFCFFVIVITIGSFFFARIQFKELRGLITYMRTPASKPFPIHNYIKLPSLIWATSHFVITPAPTDAIDLLQEYTLVSENWKKELEELLQASSQKHLSSLICESF